MGVWELPTPAGSDNLRDGDNRIREMKDALQEALSHESSTFPGASPGSTPIFIPGMSYDTTANRPTGDSLVSGRFYFNTTLQRLERYNGSSWDPVGGGVGIESGVVMSFYQASAPTGWTAVSVNDRFLRVVSAGGTGGSTGGSGLAPSDTITLAHTHTVESHDHSFSDTSSTPSATQNVETGISQTVASQTHTHTVSGTTGTASPATDSQLSDTAFQYADLILATKD